MKNNIKKLIPLSWLAGLVLVLQPISAHADSLIGPDANARDLAVAHRLMTATPEELAQMRNLINRIEQMSAEDRQTAANALRERMAEARRRTAEEMTPEQRERMRQRGGERPQRPEGAERPQRPEGAERPQRGERPQRPEGAERPQRGERQPRQ